MDEPTASTLAQRLDRVEREVRWWRALAGSSVVLLALVTLVGTAKPTGPQEITARRLVLVDSHGQPQVALGPSSGLDFYSNGSVVASLKPFDDGKVLGLSVTGTLQVPTLQVAMPSHPSIHSSKVVLDYANGVSTYASDGTETANLSTVNSLLTLTGPHGEVRLGAAHQAFLALETYAQERPEREHLSNRLWTAHKDRKISTEQLNNQLPRPSTMIWLNVPPQNTKPPASSLSPIQFERNGKVVWKAP